MGKYGKWAKIIIPDIKPISWNIFYRSHWTKQRQLKADYQEYVWAYMPKEIRNLNLTDCKIHIRAYSKSSRRIDPDNLCTKPLLDALNGCVIKDDNPKYIKSVCLESLQDKNNPRIEILINY